MPYFFIDLDYGTVCDAVEVRSRLKGLARVRWVGRSVKGNCCLEIQTSGTLSDIRQVITDSKHCIIEIGRGHGPTLARQLGFWS